MFCLWLFVLFLSFFFLLSSYFFLCHACFIIAHDIGVQLSVHQHSSRRSLWYFVRWRIGIHTFRTLDLLTWTFIMSDETPLSMALFYIYWTGEKVKKKNLIKGPLDTIDICPRNLYLALNKTICKLLFCYIFYCNNIYLIDSKVIQGQCLCL